MRAQCQFYFLLGPIDLALVWFYKELPLNDKLTIPLEVDFTGHHTQAD
jgi:hypothetical protein